MDIRKQIKAFITAAVMAAAPASAMIPTASAEDYVVENAHHLLEFAQTHAH